MGKFCKMDFGRKNKQKGVNIMNKFIGIGRTTKDIELSQTPNGISVAKFTLAIPRTFRNKDGEKEVDFINCVAWQKAAENIHKFVKKGDQLAVVGRIEVRSYEAQDKTKRYVTEVVVEEFEFIGGNKKTEKDKKKYLTEIPVDDLGDDLPF